MYIFNLAGIVGVNRQVPPSVDATRELDIRGVKGEMSITGVRPTPVADRARLPCIRLNRENIYIASAL